MSTSTAGIQIRSKRHWLNDATELISSMRFAVSLLTLISVASVIGTVLKQGEPMTNYVNQFGPFWFEVFDLLGLYSVYSTWWFLLIMTFLVLSTSLCVLRNAPTMVADMRSWRDTVREQSLRNFHHRTEWHVDMPRGALSLQLARRLASDGYKTKIVEKPDATLIAAKRGGTNKWGYIFAHSAIVIICVGGLLDSDLPIRVQKWFMGKSAFGGGGLIADVPAKHRLSINNPTFRANTMIPEGGASSSAVISQPNGVLIQDLPFQIQLKKFTVDFYSTGMPKLFASDVVIREANGNIFSATIEVNKPLIHDGVAIYQSSFDDGGSKLTLAGYPMQGIVSAPTRIRGEIGGTTPLLASDYTIEWTAFRPFNVENVAAAGSAEGSPTSQDPRAVSIDGTMNRSFADQLNDQLGSAAKSANNDAMQNVGPSVQYKLRDKNGQAREFHNYMQPIRIDGVDVFLAGIRETPSEAFRYLRIPADENDSVDGWMRLRAALQDPLIRAHAAERYANLTMPGDEPFRVSLRSQLQQSAEKGLEIFIGSGESGGFTAVSSFLDKIPVAEQENAADVFLRIFNGSLWEVFQLSRERAGLPPAKATEAQARFLQLGAKALSDAYFYGAPTYLRLQEFEEIKASVFQVTRSPGKNVVYLGSLLLVVGIFSMFYIRERRMWIWLKSAGDKTSALMAMTTQRRTLDFDKEFAVWNARLTQNTTIFHPVPTVQATFKQEIV